MDSRIKILSKSFDKVSQFFKSDSSLDQIAWSSLEEMGHTLNCQWGTYWKVELQQLRPVMTWSEVGFEAPELSRDTKHRTLSLSEGTAGHVWRTRKPIWTLDLSLDMCLPRSLDAGKSGLNGGIWFAVKTEDTVYAVIELLGHAVIPPTQELILEIERFGTFIGHLMNERMARLDFSAQIANQK